MDLAASIQAVTEEIVLRLTRALAAKTGQKNLCLAGGVALNCVANGKVLRDGKFDEIWIQPAAGDAGGAVGAALATYYLATGAARPNGGTATACAARTSGRRTPTRTSRLGSEQSALGSKFWPRKRSSARPREALAASRRSAGSRDEWNSARARSAPARSSAMLARRRCRRC